MTNATINSSVTALSATWLMVNNVVIDKTNVDIPDGITYKIITTGDYNGLYYTWNGYTYTKVEVERHVRNPKSLIVGYEKIDSIPNNVEPYDEDHDFNQTEFNNDFDVKNILISDYIEMGTVPPVEEISKTDNSFKPKYIKVNGEIYELKAKKPKLETKVTLRSGAVVYSYNWLNEITQTIGVSNSKVYKVTTSGVYKNKCYKWNGSTYVVTENFGYGEMAINYSCNNESIFIRNSQDEIVEVGGKKSQRYIDFVGAHESIVGNVPGSSGLVPAPNKPNMFLSSNGGWEEAPSNGSLDINDIKTIGDGNAVTDGEISEDGTTINLIKNGTFLTQHQQLKTLGTGLESSVTGDSTIKGNGTISLKTASDNEIGGIRTGFTPVDGKRPVEIVNLQSDPNNENGKAYVEINPVASSLVSSGLKCFGFAQNHSSGITNITSGSYIPILDAIGINRGKISIQFEIFGREDSGHYYGKYLLCTKTGGDNPELICLEYYSNSGTPNRFEYNDLVMINRGGTTSSTTGSTFELSVYKRHKDGNSTAADFFTVQIIEENISSYTTFHYYYSLSSSDGDTTYKITESNKNTLVKPSGDTIDGNTLNTPKNATYYPQDITYYHTPDYTTGLKIATGNGVGDMYVPTGTTFNTVAVGNHGHGKITNDGKIANTDNVTINNNDRLIISDASDDYRLKNSSVIFDGNTINQFLSKKGTWETLPGVATIGGDNPGLLQIVANADGEVGYENIKNINAIPIFYGTIDNMKIYNEDEGTYEEGESTRCHYVNLYDVVHGIIRNETLLRILTNAIKEIL